ncbi:MAG: hypothetical protein LBK05_00180 [Treponema sp.]|jgi:hypothetical protein|nr:hypothetical protein [Treponema sp.]
MPKAGDKNNKDPDPPTIPDLETNPDLDRQGLPQTDAPPSSGTPPAGSGAEGANPQQTGADAGALPAADNSGPPAPEKEGKKRIRCAALKGGKIIAGKGVIIQIDENGFFEVDEKEAVRLLTIPDYEEA